jgi:hypothetical protein
MGPQDSTGVVEGSELALLRTEQRDEQTLELAGSTLVDVPLRDWLFTSEEFGVGADAVEVVEVQEPGQATAEAILALGCAGLQHSGGPAHLGEGVPALVHIVEVEAGLVQVARERHVAQFPQFPHPLGPPGREGGADVVQHDRLGDGIELHLATGREIGEVLGDIALDLPAGPAEHPAVAKVEAKGLHLLTDEVEHGQHVLALAAAQASAQLLQEHGGALGRAQHEHDIDGGNVDALVEQVDREQDLHLAGLQGPERPAALAAGAVG